MTDEGRVVGHTFDDPEEALRHFTPEREAAARPREIRLDASGRRLDPPHGDALTTAEDDGRG